MIKQSSISTLQAKASKLLLDVAERTHWRWGPFGELNRIREEQRRDLVSFYATHPIPKHIGIRLETLTLILPISTDRLIAYKQIILDALQQSRDDAEEFERSYRSIVERTSRGGHMRVGRIQKTRSNWTRNVTVSESLPALRAVY